MKNPFEDLFDTTIAGVFDPETVGAPEEVVEKLLPLLRPLLQEDGPLGSELGDEYQVAYALVWFAQYVFKRGVYDPVEIMHCRSLEAQRPRVTRTPFHVWGYKRGTGSKSNDVHMLVDVEPDDISPYVVAEKIAGDDYIFVSSCYCHELVPSTSGTSSCRPPSCTRRSQHSWRRKTMQSENIFVDAFDVTIAGVHDPRPARSPRRWSKGCCRSCAGCCAGLTVR
jgi:hypothetical protein